MMAYCAYKQLCFQILMPFQPVLEVSTVICSSTFCAISYIHAHICIYIFINIQEYGMEIASR